MQGLYFERLPSTPNLLAYLEQSAGRMSSTGVRYTSRQLYYEFCRTLLPLSHVAVVWSGIAIVGSVVTGVLRRHHPLWSGITGAAVQLVVPSLIHRLPFTLMPPVNDALFYEVLKTYRAHYGDPPGLLPDHSVSRPALHEREPDLYDYGLAYVLVCQNASIAHMLRANFLHMEMRCAILAQEEAFPLPDPLVAMLMRTATLRVLLLHDASPEGLRWIDQAASLLDVPQHFQITTLGLRPMYALRHHLFALRRATDTADLPASLNIIERTWLWAGYQVELAALPPTGLLRVLQRAVRPIQRRDSWWSELRRWRISGYMS